MKEEKGIQGDNLDVLSVQPELTTRYIEKMSFIKYDVSEDRSSIVELVGVGTLRCRSTYHEYA